MLDSESNLNIMKYWNMKKSALTLALLCLAITSFADTTLITNLNGYTLNSDRELVKFSALQFTDDKVDRTYTVDDEYRAILKT